MILNLASYLIMLSIFLNIAPLHIIFFYNSKSSQSNRSASLLRQNHFALRITFVQSHKCFYKDQASIAPSITPFIVPISWAFFLINSEMDELEKPLTQRFFALGSAYSP